MKSNFEYLIRETVKTEDPANIREIVSSTNFFNDEEVGIAVELVEERLDKGEASGYHFLFAEIDGKTSSHSSPLQVQMFTLGDVNYDGLLNSFDIDPFTEAVTQGKDAYYTLFPTGYYYTADCNLDTLVNSFDIDPFVCLLTGCP